MTGCRIATTNPATSPTPPRARRPRRTREELEAFGDRDEEEHDREQQCRQRVGVGVAVGVLPLGEEGVGPRFEVVSGLVGCQLVLGQGEWTRPQRLRFVRGSRASHAS